MLPTLPWLARLQAGIMRVLLGLPSGLLRRLAGRPVSIDGQELNAEAQLALKLIALAGGEDLESLSIAEKREQMRANAASVAGRAPAVAKVSDMRLAGASGAVAGRLYVPRTEGTPGDGDPLLVYYHGGGFAAGDLETHDNACRFLAAHSGARLLAVDYRRAPEARFPAAFEDAMAAFDDALARAGELGADPARIGVGGDSAGGNLAAGVAQARARERGPAPVFQLLVYPWLDLSGKRDSYRLFRDGFYLTEADLDWYRAHYLEREEDALDPRCSPLRASDVAGVAPAYIATAGFDPLRDDGEEYANRLRSAGVAVALRRHEGLIHGFLNTAGVGHAARDALLEACGALRLGLAAR